MYGIQAKHQGIVTIAGVDTQVESDIPLEYLRFLYQSPPVRVQKVENEPRIVKPRISTGRLSLVSSDRQPSSNESDLLNRFSNRDRVRREPTKKVFDLTTEAETFSFTRIQEKSSRTFDLTKTG